MPQPLSERQSLKAELAEIPRQIAAYWNELENGSPKRARRESLPRRASGMTRAQQAGLLLEDVAPPSLAKRRSRYRLDAQVRKAFGLVLRRRRPKKAGR
jgi:hypothetical protein